MLMRKSLCLFLPFPALHFFTYTERVQFQFWQSKEHFPLVNIHFSFYISGLCYICIVKSWKELRKAHTSCLFLQYYITVTRLHIVKYNISCIGITEL